MTMNLAAVAASFYDAVASGDLPALNAVLSSSFAKNAVLVRPESLPGGGTLNGRQRIVRFMERAAGKAPLVVLGMEVNPTGTDAFAHVEITIAGRTARALEWWSAVDDEVISVKAFYFDTAAMLAVD